MVGGMCALLGVFILTLPLPIVVNSFSTIYKNRYKEYAASLDHIEGSVSYRFLIMSNLGYGEMKLHRKKQVSYS